MIYITFDTTLDTSSFSTLPENIKDLIKETKLENVTQVKIPIILAIEIIRQIDTTNIETNDSKLCKKIRDAMTEKNNKLSEVKDAALDMLPTLLNEKTKKEGIVKFVINMAGKYYNIVGSINQNKLWEITKIDEK